MNEDKSIILFTLILFVVISPTIHGEEMTKAEGGKTCAVYFTGVGCPHCAKADPVVLKEMVKNHSDLVVIEYEIYQLRENAPLIQDFNSKYNTGLGVPLVIFGKDNSIKGDNPIINNIEAKIENLQGKKCPTTEGKIAFNELNFNKLAGKPKIWADERILIKQGTGNVSEKVFRQLLTENPEKVLENVSSENVEPHPVLLSGSQVRFENAVEIDGWVFQWGFEENTEPKSGGGLFKENSILVLVVIIVIGIVIIWGLKR